MNKICTHYSVHQTGNKKIPYQCNDCGKFFKITLVTDGISKENT